MPAVRVFIDSTTFLYTFDRNEPAKGRVALDWLVALRRAEVGTTNLQALNEVASVATREADRFGGYPFIDIDGRPADRRRGRSGVDDRRPFRP